MTFLPSDSNAPYLPTSQVFPEDQSQLLIVLTDIYTQIALRLNQREIGSYASDELVSGKEFFNSSNPMQPRLGYRKVFESGAITAGTTATIAHGISGVNSSVTFTDIYGSVITDVVDNRPLPFISATAVNEQIEINIDATNINIIVGAGSPGVTSGVVVLEFLKN